MLYRRTKRGLVPIRNPQLPVPVSAFQCWRHNPEDMLAALVDWRHEPPHIYPQFKPREVKYGRAPTPGRRALIDEGLLARGRLKMGPIQDRMSRAVVF